MKLNNELNNMSWRIRPEEIVLEMARIIDNKLSNQQQIYDFLKVFNKEENQEYRENHLNHNRVRNKN